MKAIALLATLAAALAVPTAYAQSSSTGTAAQGQSANDVTKVPTRAMLPAAGGGSGSGAPGMQVDCQKDPSKCSDPVKNGAASSPGLPAQSK